jgi:precorrin-2 dehydrogenase/sirohydrochlorin ferrochelatase
MSYLVNLVVARRPAVVIGGGSIASRKIHDLLEACADVTVIAPVVCAPIQDLAGAGRIKLHLRPYGADDIAGAFLVVAATDDESLNSQISRDAQSRGIFVNVVDRPALCTFTLPAVVRRGDLTIAISTEGQCPALASVMREKLAGQFGDEYASLVAIMGALRRQLMCRGWSGGRIRGVVRELYSRGIAEMIRTNDREAVSALWRAVLGDDFSPPNP